jgi:NitT/TauT family transport system substrate-binding protein
MKLAHLLCALLLLTSCASGGGGTAQGTLSVGVIPFPGYAPLYVAEELGVCQKAGLTLKLVESTDQSALDTVLASGDVDLGAYGNTSLVFANGAGIPLQAVLTIDYSVGADAVVARGVGSVEELSSSKKRFATDQADIAYFVLMAAAQRKGLQPQDFEHVQMPNSQALPAFTRGSVDAIGVAEPLLGQALQLDGATLIASTKDDPGIVSDVFAGTADRIGAKRQELRTLRTCWQETLRTMREDPQRAGEIVARRLGIRADEVGKVLGAVKWPDDAEGETYLRNGKLAETLRTASTLYQQLGLFRQTPPPVERMIADAP